MITFTEQQKLALTEILDEDYKGHQWFASTTLAELDIEADRWDHISYEDFHIRKIVYNQRNEIMLTATVKFYLDDEVIEEWDWEECSDYPTLSKIQFLGEEASDNEVMEILNRMLEIARDPRHSYQML